MRGIILLIFVLYSLFSCQKSDNEFSELSKIALRDVGNKLLTANNDTTSLVLPITKKGTNKYELKFQNQLGIEPDSLVLFVKNSFEIASLPKEYRVEVIQCEDEEVAYSFEVKNDKENDIIPCQGRNLPHNCYYVQVRFVKNTFPISINYVSIATIAFLGFGFLFRLKNNKKIEESYGSFSKIGGYEFHLEQNKLIYNKTEIHLSKKECELLEILNEQKNCVVKREELTKRIWEDHGVFVGRSLDTYISKLRKKLSKDATIKITNFHGIGYRLEV